MEYLTIGNLSIEMTPERHQFLRETGAIVSDGWGEWIVNPDRETFSREELMTFLDPNGEMGF